MDEEENVKPTQNAAVGSKGKTEEAADSDDDSEDSVPLKKLAAMKKRGKGKATKVTLGKKSTPSPRLKANNSLDFEDDSEESQGEFFSVKIKINFWWGSDVPIS